MRYSLRCLLLAALVVCSTRLSIGQEMNATLFQLKAVFIYNFTQFIEWPPEQFGNPDAPFIIGIYGPNELGIHLDEAVRNEKVRDHPIRIVAIASLDEVSQCHLLFINRARAAELPEIKSRLKRQSTLTVSDARDFCRSGGAIGFIQDRNKIKIQINTDAAANSNLKISSKLLRLAEIVSSR